MKKFDSVQQILDFAIKKEQASHDFYIKLAKNADKPEMKQACMEFASQELVHKLKLEAIKAGEIKLEEEEIGDLDLADTVAEVWVYSEMKYQEMLVLAMKRELQAFKLYCALAKMAKQQELKDTFLLLAQEEEQHKLKLELEYDLASF
ncbi:MAG: ferritin-like domain-containing protein [Planctomycetota bacterium]|jgi:rubrerythrin